MLLPDFDERSVSHIMPRAFLAPEIIEAIVEGNHFPALSFGALPKDIPPNWIEQRRIKVTVRIATIGKLTDLPPVNSPSSMSEALWHH